MGVSKNKGTPKWMMKIMENPIKMDDFGDTIIFGNTQIEKPTTTTTTRAAACTEEISAPFGSKLAHYIHYISSKLKLFASAPNGQLFLISSRHEKRQVFPQFLPAAKFKPITQQHFSFLGANATQRRQNKFFFFDVFVFGNFVRIGRCF